MCRGRRPSSKRWLIVGSTIVILGLALSITWVSRRLVVDLPSPDRLYERAAAPSTHIYDRRGRLLYEIIDPHGGSHVPVPLTDLPPACAQAVIATEDATFYSNPGVDARAIIRALWINIRGGEVLSGGSTITQQLARNLLLSPQERTEITLKRKLRETILAWRLARAYTKDEILALYLNETYYGNLAYGIEAAAHTYFAKGAAELDLAECAFLAGLPQSPATYNPFENPGSAQARQQTVLDLMVRRGFITQQEAASAADERLGFASTQFAIEAPHLVMYVRGLLEREFGTEALYTQGLRVHTTLDLDMQRAAERIVDYRLAQLADTSRTGFSHNVHNAAVVALDPHTGEVLTMVGSPNYFDPQIDGAVNAAVAPRQPGSSIKPITYAAAFDPHRSEPLTGASVVMDVRTAFTTQEGAPYVPRNYDRQWRGPVLVRQALASSYNVVATKVLDMVGVDATANLARAMGITTFDNRERLGLALTLGGSEVRLLELTAAYGAFANGGYRVEPVVVTRVEDSRGRLLKAWEATPSVRVLDERVAYLITDILSDNTARTPAFGEGSALQISRPAAAKTGTSTDWRDNWTIGYTPDLVVGVWAGNADNTPMVEVSGVMGAAPIWHDTMEALLKGSPVREFREPPGMVRAEVCADSGLPPAQIAREIAHSTHRPVLTRCPHTVDEIFISGTEPTAHDNWHWLIPIDTRNGLLAGSECPEEVVTYRPYTRYPAEAQDWARSNNIPQPPDVYSPWCMAGEIASVSQHSTDAHRASTTDASARAMVMTSPDSGSQYRLSPQIPETAQQIFVAVRPVDGIVLQEVTLFADGRLLATLDRPPYQVLWQMTSGAHTFTATGIDAHGRRLTADHIDIVVIE